MLPTPLTFPSREAEQCGFCPFHQPAPLLLPQPPSPQCLAAGGLPTSLSTLAQAVRTQTKAIWSVQYSVSQRTRVAFYQCTLVARQLTSWELCLVGWCTIVRGCLSSGMLISEKRISCLVLKMLPAPPSRGSLSEREASLLCLPFSAWSGSWGPCVSS